MSRPVVAIARREVLSPGVGWRQGEPMAFRASLGDKRLTIFGLYSWPERTHARVPRLSSTPPMRATYFEWIGPGSRFRITLTEYPKA